VAGASGGSGSPGERASTSGVTASTLPGAEATRAGPPSFGRAANVLVGTVTSPRENARPRKESVSSTCVAFSRRWVATGVRASGRNERGAKGAGSSAFDQERTTRTGTARPGTTRSASISTRSATSSAGIGGSEPQAPRGSSSAARRARGTLIA
jgi:hypothetical protein